MESYLERKKDNFKIAKKHSDECFTNDLIKEYCLKRGQFNPKKPSPNRFCNKLEYRMKSYYNTLYNLSSSPPK